MSDSVLVQKPQTQLPTLIAELASLNSIFPKIDFIAKEYQTVGLHNIIYRHNKDHTITTTYLDVSQNGRDVLSRLKNSELGSTVQLDAFNRYRNGVIALEEFLVGNDDAVLSKEYLFHKDLIVRAGYSADLQSSWFLYPHLLGSFLFVEEYVQETANRITGFIPEEKTENRSSDGPTSGINITKKQENTLSLLATTPQETQNTSSQKSSTTSSPSGGGNTLMAPPVSPASSTPPRNQTQDGFTSGHKIKTRIEEASKLSDDTKRLKRTLGEITNSISNPTDQVKREILQKYGDLDTFLRSKYGQEIQNLSKNHRISYELLELQRTFEENFSAAKTGINGAQVQVENTTKLSKKLEETVFAKNIESFAYGYSLLELNKNNGASTLAEAKRRIPGVVDFLRENPHLEEEFDLYFSLKVREFRIDSVASAKADSRKVFLFEDIYDQNDPAFAKLSTNQKAQLKELSVENQVAFLETIAELRSKANVDVEVFLGYDREQIKDAISLIQKDLQALQAAERPFSDAQKEEIIRLQQQQEIIKLTYQAQQIASSMTPIQNSGTGAAILGLVEADVSNIQSDQIETMLRNGNLDAQKIMESVSQDEVVRSQPNQSGGFLSSFRQSKNSLLKKGSDQKKSMQAFKKSAEIIGKLSTNPAAIGAMLGAGGVGLTALSFLSNVTLGAFTGAGGLIGGGLGALASLFPPLAPFAPILIGGGATFGSAIGNVMGNWYLTGTPQLGLGNAGFGNFTSVAQATAQNAGLPTGEAMGSALQAGASNATTTGSGLGKLGAKLAGDVAGKGISGASNLLSGLQNLPSAFTSVGSTTAIVGVPLGGAAVLTIAAITSLAGSFLIPGEVIQDNPYFSVVKSATPTFSEDPTKVEYTITITPKGEYQVTILGVTDKLSFASKTPATDLAAFGNVAPVETINTLAPGTPLSGPISVSYSINFADTPEELAAFADTLVTNLVTFRFTVTGPEAPAGEQTFSANAAVTFGQPPVLACWPATGTIIQGPRGPFSHSAVDAIDIKGVLNSPIVSPFSGRAAVYNEQTTGNFGGVYGNHIVVQTDQGFQLLFGHMSGFANSWRPGETHDIVAGTIIGYMGFTSSNPKFGYAGNEHLHYEYRPAGPPNASLLETILPQPLLYSSRWVVTGTQQVSIDSCDATGEENASGEIADTVECVDFINGQKDWSTNELSQYKSVMSQMFSIPNVKESLCKAGRIEIIRYDPDPASQTEGCEINTPGQGGAEVISSSQIAVCDLMFSSPSRFGTATMWHEPGHILQQRFPIWNSMFEDFENDVEGYISTYPLTKTKAEDFSEAFGLCGSTLFKPGYRENATITREQYPKHCAQITGFLTEAAK